MSNLGDVSSLDPRQYAADSASNPQLARLGLNTLAMGEALRKLFGKQGDISNRLVAGLVVHTLQDYESMKKVRDDLKPNTPIPANWKAKSILPNIEENIFAWNMAMSFNPLLKNHL